LDLRSRHIAYMGQDERPYTRHIRENASSVDFILTTNEKEALLLESQLIKAHKPRFNISLKDDKTYVSIRVTTEEKWPGIYITRRIKERPSTYFGPFSSVHATKKTLSAIGRIFPVRRCSNAEFNNRIRPCIYHQIGLCIAPCVKRCTKEEYDQTVRDLIAFLEGKDKGLVSEMKKRMEDLSERLEFEKAARIRDQIEAIHDTWVPQAIVGKTQLDVDVFGMYRGMDTSQIAVLRISKGTLVDTHNLSMENTDTQDIMTACIMQFYLGTKGVPGIIYTDCMPEQRENLEGILSGIKGSAVHIRRATRGRPRQWMEMARNNALNTPGQTDTPALDEIAKAFLLPAIPYYMECYDISTIQGRFSVGSRVVFVNGSPRKDAYRRYRIRDVSGQDDFGMMMEVLGRRFSHETMRPDLIVIDGGKGQLNVCLKVLKQLDRQHCPVVAIAKKKADKTDRFFLPGRKDPVFLPERGEGIKLLRSIRDEAHRFAITYHRHLRSKAIKTSWLEAIPGIGPKKAAK
ncbi:MAG: excinuclease ABC subunit UvrC, partial [Thermodesulfobacteriota bacterium]|nr:excinuclease ABC subunit UvrC [Thermodesulfobacteriota bacterium]